jgi:hypothetical protein
MPESRKLLIQRGTLSLRGGLHQSMGSASDQKKPRAHVPELVLKRIASLLDEKPWNMRPKIIYL